MGANALVLIAAALAGVLGNIPWLYHRGPRFTAWMEATSAFLLIAGLPAWAAVLAAATATQNGLGWLAVIFLVSMLCMYYEAWYRYKPPKVKNGITPPGPKKPKREHYHPVRTMIIAFVFGTTLFMVIARRADLVKLLAKLPPATLHAIHHSTATIQDGHASKAIAGGSASQLLIVAVIAFIGLIILRSAIKHTRLMPRLKRKNRNGSSGARGTVSSRG